jgi:hypothetical protein
MQKHLQTVDTLKTTATTTTTTPAPVELTPAQLQQVGGGLTGPAGTWASTTSGPAGTW